MTHPELTITVFPAGIQISEVGGRAYGATSISPDNATRLVACWNACREFEDPFLEIAKLREGNQSLLQKLSEKDDPHSFNTDYQGRIAGFTAEDLQSAGRTLGGISMLKEKQEDQQPTPEHLAYQLLRSLILSSAK